MEPTNAEIIFWAVCAIIGWGAIIWVMCRPDDHIKMTPSKRRDIEKIERKWR